MNSTIKARIESIRRGEVPEGYKRTKIGIVPNEWKKVRLGDYLVKHKEVSEYNNQYPVLTSSRRGIFLQSDYYKQEVASEDNTGYNVVPKGYFTYRHMSDDNIFRFNINTIVEKGIVSTLYPVFTTRGICDDFLLVLLNNGREFSRFAILQKQGGSRTYIYFDKLQELKIWLPSISEQEKIAEILAGQDRVIALKEKLLAEKQKQKKYLMQQLLAGKKRLPGFSGEWKKSLLGDLFRERVETNCTELRLLAITGGQGVIPRDELELKDNSSEDKSKYKKICVGDIGYNTMRMWQGVSAFSNYEGIVSPAYTILMPNSEIDAKFFAYLFKLPSIIFLFYRYSQGLVDDTRNLKYENLKRIRVLFPQDKKEQVAIAEILSTADKEIELLKKDIEQEKLKKKSLMQLLLTGMVRVL